jgi:periplasmic divalent cation tolerance protein
MKTTTRHVVVLVTAPDLKTARRLVRAALEAKVTACGNLVPGVESHYWWQGKLEKGREVLIVFKTTRQRLGRLGELVRANHPYDTPEILALRVGAGSGRYLDWVTASVRG